MTWSDFDTKTALERDTLMRALPLVATASDGTAHGIIDMAETTSTYIITAGDHFGANPTQCVELLGIRPLLVGTAWKVLDVLIEVTLVEAHVPPDKPNGDREIASKARQANRTAPGPGIPPPAWSALTVTYRRTVELRHALVHRTAYMDPSGALIGVGRGGQALRPMTAPEQESFGRAVLRAAQLVTAAQPDERVAADLTAQLASLRGIHEVPLQVTPRIGALPELTVILVPGTGPDGTYLLDLGEVRRRSSLGTTSAADLVIRFHDRPGQELRGRMEKAPTDRASINPDRPPSWLAF